MENRKRNRENEKGLPPCNTSASCAEHARLWAEIDEPCDDGRGYLASPKAD